jgi:glyoxylase-like metal-dependent hydrolase (beta-lactamase superfamily II)
MINVLREGVHTKHTCKGYNNYDPIYSSTTLIVKDKANILVDPGHIAERKAIEDLLLKEGKKPEDINWVLITHHHLDHCSNMGSFPNAKIFTGNGYVTQKEAVYKVFKDMNLFEEETGVKVISTPGHTPDSVSYLYEQEGIKYMCVGDAVYEESIREGEFKGVEDRKRYLDSLEEIFTSADVIIPGHGAIIEGEHKRELYKIIKNYER